jgi:hypothetical protein
MVDGDAAAFVPLLHYLTNGMSAHVTRYYHESGFLPDAVAQGAQRSGDMAASEELVECALTAIRHFGGIYTYASRTNAPRISNADEFFQSANGWAQLSLVLTYLEICVALHNIFVKTARSKHVASGVS